MGNCCTSVSPEEKQSFEEFKKYDVDKDGVLSQDELATYIGSQPKTWAMLGVNLNLDDTRCREIATHVAYHLATGKGEFFQSENQNKQQQNEETILNKEEFHTFRQDYVIDPRGSQEFFHRTVFAAFDEDFNGVLDRKELDKFLDIFYKDDSIFAGDKRLPKKKKKLRKMVMDKLDANNDGLLSFVEIRGLLSGNLDLMGLSEAEKSEKTKRTTIKAKRKSSELQRENSKSQRRKASEKKSSTKSSSSKSDAAPASPSSPSKAALQTRNKKSSKRK